MANFFSPDDLVLWEWTRGLISAPNTLWRYLPGRLYFGLAIDAFGTNPFPYFLVNWLLHGINVALIYVLVRRLGASAFAATLAAGLFAGSRLFTTAVGQAVGFGDLLALFFALVASIAMTFPTRWASTAAMLAFILALMSKEIVVALPVALLFAPSVGASLADRARRLTPLFAVGVLWLLYLSASGARGSVLGGPAYARAFGRNLFDSILMYAQWSADLRGIAPDYGAERPGHSWLGGLWVLIPVVLATWLARRRSWLPLVGLTWWMASLAPVLPLLFQKHLHYLYSPSVGFALLLGSLFGVVIRALQESLPSTRGARGHVVAWAIVGLLVLSHAAISWSLLDRRYHERLTDVDLPRDTFLRKMEIARRTTATIRESIGDRPTRVAFYNPLIRGDVDFYAHLLPSVLDGGRGLRALYPNIDSVLFVRRWIPALSDFEMVVANEDGRALYFGRGPEANQRLIQTLAANGFAREAADLLVASVSAYPRDPTIQAMYARYLSELK